MRSTFTQAMVMLMAVAAGPALAADRGRVEVVDNTIVTDGGTLIRACRMDVGHASWPYTNYAQRADHWAQIPYNGFNAVRLACWRDPGYVCMPPDYYAEIIEACADLASANGLYLIVSCHSEHSAFNRDTVTEFWDVVAPRFKDRTHLLYELNHLPTPNDDKSARETFFDRFVSDEKEIYNRVRSDAPNTHVTILSWYNLPTYEMVKKFDGTVEWTNSSVGFRGVGRHSVLRELRSSFPMFVVELSPFLGFTQYSGIESIDLCEELHLSWSYKAGYSPTSLAVFRDGAEDAELHWDPDHGVWPDQYVGIGAGARRVARPTASVPVVVGMMAGRGTRVARSLDLRGRVIRPGTPAAVPFIDGVGR